MKYFLIITFLLLSQICLSQARKGKYIAESYQVFDYDSNVCDYVITMYNPDTVKIRLYKEGIIYSGAVDIINQISYFGVSEDDDAFVYFTPVSMVVIQRELKYWIIYYNKRNDGKYETVINLNSVKYMGN